MEIDNSIAIVRLRIDREREAKLNLETANIVKSIRDKILILESIEVRFLNIVELYVELANAYAKICIDSVFYRFDDLRLNIERDRFSSKFNILLNSIKQYRDFLVRHLKDGSLNGESGQNNIIKSIDIRANYYFYLANALRNTYQHRDDVVVRTINRKGFDHRREVLTSKWLFKFKYDELRHDERVISLIKDDVDYKKWLNNIIDKDGFGDLIKSLRMILNEMFRIQNYVRSFNNCFIEVYASFLSDFQNMLNASVEELKYDYELFIPGVGTFDFGPFQYEYIHYIQNLYVGIPDKLISIDI